MSDPTVPSLWLPSPTGRPHTGLPIAAGATIHDPCPCVTVAVPDMVDRGDIRRVTAHIRDIPGVVAVEAHLEVRRIHVEGVVSRGDVRAAVVAAGYTVTDDLS